MTTDRLQLTLIPEVNQGTQSLAVPPEVRARSIELIAMMLVRLVRDQRVIDDGVEVCDESC